MTRFGTMWIMFEAIEETTSSLTHEQQQLERNADPSTTSDVPAYRKLHDPKLNRRPRGAAKVLASDQSL
jgi:hypothetical protein